MKFVTDLNYTDRQSKLQYVADKYRDILKNSILDVGSDRCYLKEYLPEGTHYIGVGLGGKPDIEINLEREKLPFSDQEFECVICLDVLEHLDNIHAVFDELCRVTSSYVIISLPNPYHDFMGMLIGSEEVRASNFKYYGLPPEKPDDRHKWFFSSQDAEHFISERARRNGVEVIQIDNDGNGPAKGLSNFFKRMATRLASPFISVKPEELYFKTTWAVLKKPG